VGESRTIEPRSSARNSKRTCFRLRITKTSRRFGSRITVDSRNMELSYITTCRNRRRNSVCLGKSETFRGFRAWTVGESRTIEPSSSARNSKRTCFRLRITKTSRGFGSRITVDRRNIELSYITTCRNRRGNSVCLGKLTT